MRTPKADCEALFNAVIPVAQRLLTTLGGFSPFGAAMRPDGKILSLSAYDGEENRQSVHLLALMKDALTAGARTGEYKATAIAFDVRVGLPSTDEKSDAIAVMLDHQDDYSVVVFVPYTLASGKLTTGTASAQRGDASIFPPR